MSDVWALGVAVVLLVLNAFFVGAEFALISARRTQIEPLALEGSVRARATLRAMEHISVVMAGAQLGITICSLGLGAVAEPALAHLLEPGFHALGLPDVFVHPVAFVLALMVVVYLHVVLGEMVPKNIAIAGPDRAALALALPMWWVVTVFRPIIVVVNACANLVLKMLRVEPKDEVSSSFTRDEVASLVEQSRGEGLLGDDEYERLSGALGFTEQTVETVLLPLADLSTVPRGCTIDQVEELCAETGFSRFPVKADDGDLVGYLHIKDVLAIDAERLGRMVDDKWIRPFAAVLPTDALHDVLATLQRKRAHVARVVDAEGATLGLATMEDVLEELVGEIRDAAHTAEH